MKSDRRQIIAGNWKLNKGAPAEAVALASELKDRLPGGHGAEVVVCPPFTALHAVHLGLAGTSIRLGAQNMFQEANGAYTGEISAPMLRAVGCTHVILGHSERRQIFGETDEGVNKKLGAALGAGLTAIVCCGETLRDRELGKTIPLVQGQIVRALEGLTADDAVKVVLAYEPIWAIGTGRTASSDQAQEVHAAIRGVLQELFGQATAERVRIQYGGSVKAENAAELLGKPDVDGLLVGGASLSADGFAKIVAAGK